MKPRNAYFVYLALEAAVALIFGMLFTASSVYQVTVAELSALQLVLVGTTLELAVFVFEIPTGVVADVYSRRLSIIIGFFLIGVGFLVEGSFPIFWAILLAQVLWGLGWTFTSGATEAWISDEIGEAAAGRAFLRSNQVGQISSLLGLGLGMLLGSIRVSLPLQLGGLCFILLGILLILVMPETGFQPLAGEERSSWRKFALTFKEGLRTVRKRPALLSILAIGLVYGLYSEGIDRLWTKHILDTFTFPRFVDFPPVVWMGLVRAVGALFSIVAAEIARRKVDTQSHSSVSQALFFISTILVLSMFGFSLAGSLVLALLAYWMIDMLRDVIGPLYTAWVNQRLDPQVRATVISMSGQVDAFGQIAGGPLVGLVGNLVSVRAALLTSSAILTPVLFLYRRLRKENGQRTDALPVDEE